MFSLNAGKYGPETFRMRTLFTQSEHSHSKNQNGLCHTPNFLKQIRIKNVNRLVIEHLNIYSLKKKLGQLIY